MLDAQENQQGAGNIGSLGNIGNVSGGGGGGGNGGGAMGGGTMGSGNNNMRKNFDGPPQNRNFQGGMGGGNMVSHSYFKPNNLVEFFFLLLFHLESFEIEKYLTNVCNLFLCRAQYID